MTLFRHIIQVFALPQRTACWELSLLLQGRECWRIGGVLIDRDDPRGHRVLCPEGFLEEALGSLGIARCAQQKVDGLARGIDGPIEIILLLLDLDMRLIDAVRVIGRGEMRPIALVEFGRIALDPTKHGGVSDGDASFPQQCFDITITQSIAQILPHATHDDLTRKVTPFEEWELIHERSPVI